MKIDRFNKINESEKFSNQILDRMKVLTDEIYERQTELDDIQSSLKETMKDYLVYKNSLLDEDDIEKPFYEDSLIFSIEYKPNYQHHTFKPEDTVLQVDYSVEGYEDDDEIENIYLTPEDIEDFIKFTNDPKLYKDAKKYNI